MIEVTPDITLNDDEVQERFIRAAGPGGQNVNKVSTAVELRFDVRGSPSLPNDVAIRLMKLGGRKVTLDGVLVLVAMTHRTQERNRADAIERLQELVDKASVAPVYRVPTRPTRASKERRLDGKAKRATIKSGRGRPSGDD